MLKATLVTVFVIFCINSSYSRNKDTSIFYYRYLIPRYEYAGSHQVKTIDSADYFRIILPPDSGEELYNVKEFYKNGGIKFIGKASGNWDFKSNIRLLQDQIPLQGQSISFFPGGKKRTIANYNNGFKDGIAYDYYPDGKLYCRTKNMHPVAIYKRGVNENRLLLDCYDLNGNMTAKDGNGHWANYDTEFKNIIIQGPVKDGYVDGEWLGGTMDSDSIKLVYLYKKGDLIKAVSYDKTGKEYTFTTASVPATYKNSNVLFINILRDHVVLPKDNLGKKIRDTVSVSFVVEKDSHLSNFEIVGKPNPALGDAVLNVVKQSRDWQSRKYYGTPLRSKITISLDMRNEQEHMIKYSELILDVKLIAPPSD
jgi:antitoxin component YwqK of YwqJK toxin-antitoxin module